ncbi:hypothetical protein [Streptomyces sp. NBC_01422]|uniref:hypothetical protein n=1 Tax=Streptomyces sp. NBC_01422 TaxID=2903859 RepID=UPI002E2CBA0E|nr:hypothetical protein [Streptomyces sp. NBC_01422]
MTSTITRPGHRSGLPDTPRAGTIDDIGREDDRAGHDGRGYERDETDQFHKLVDRLVADGDTRAQAVGRKARRTLAEMAPGYKQQPVLLLAPTLTFRPTNGQCPLCDRWNCGGTDCPPSATASGAIEIESSGELQCDQCSGWFGFTGWTCPACKQLQAATLPMRPTPHERDGRTEQPPPPARPHSTATERHRP